MLRKRLNPFGDLNLSRLILIAISQIDAILTIFEFEESSISILLYQTTFRLHLETKSTNV